VARSDLPLWQQCMERLRLHPVRRSQLWGHSTWLFSALQHVNGLCGAQDSTCLMHLDICGVPAAPAVSGPTRLVSLYTCCVLNWSTLLLLFMLRTCHLPDNHALAASMKNGLGLLDALKERARRVRAEQVSAAHSTPAAMRHLLLWLRHQRCSCICFFAHLRASPAICLLMLVAIVSCPCSV
jgi:hypothetical protein